jgi:hypothetical protein
MGKKTKRTAAARKQLTLTKAQLQFCEHYALTGNGAESYLKAYPASKKHTPQYRAEHASHLLATAKIRDKISQLAEKVAVILDQKFEITAEKVLQELAAIAFQNSADYFEWGIHDHPVRRKNKETGKYEIMEDENGFPVTEPVPFAVIKPSSDLTKVQKAAIVSVSETITKTGDRMIEAKMADKLGALKLLGAHLKIFGNDKPGPNVNVGAGGTVNLIVSPSEAAL